MSRRAVWRVEERLRFSDWAATRWSGSLRSGQGQFRPREKLTGPSMLCLETQRSLS